MLASARSRALQSLALTRSFSVAATRSYAFSANDKQEINDTTGVKAVPNVSKTNEQYPIETHFQDTALQETTKDAEALRTTQAPNRKSVWSRSQNPREMAMSGPRFEQTIMKYQPAPYSAVELAHKQHVRWTHERYVECDGGGGPLGHPKIFINLDKPQICHCTYCGLPFANEHHKHHLESLPTTAYPLYPTGDSADVNESQRVTDEPMAQR